jgi:hypothetical protein
MSTELPVSVNGNGHANGSSTAESFTVKAGLARMLKGGVIMDVVNAEQVRRCCLLFPAVTHLSDSYRPASLRKPELWPSWPWSVSPQILEPREGLRACPILR